MNQTRIDREVEASRQRERRRVAVARIAVIRPTDGAVLAIGQDESRMRQLARRISPADGWRAEVVVKTVRVRL